VLAADVLVIFDELLKILDDYLFLPTFLIDLIERAISNCNYIDGVSSRRRFLLIYNKGFPVMAYLVKGVC